MLAVVPLLVQTTGIEQIAPPVSPAAAARVEQPKAGEGTRAPIAQLPAVAKAVEQPLPPRRPPVADDAAADAARAYAAILGGTGVASPATPGDLTGRTLSDAAAAASLAAPNATRQAAPVVTGKRP